MRRILLIACSLAAAAAPAWANTPGPTDARAGAVRCAVIGERLPKIMDLTVAMMRAMAAQAPGMPGATDFEQTIGAARPALAAAAVQMRASALTAVGGDAKLLEAEMAKVRPDYAALDTVDPTDVTAMQSLMIRIEADTKPCQAATNSPASPKGA